MKNKRGITHIEAILSILIFLSGITVAFLLARPVFMTKEPTEIQLSMLEKEFREDVKSEMLRISFYVLLGDTSCIDDYGIIEGEDSPYLIYTTENNLINILQSCSLFENQYTFPIEVEIYDYELIQDFDSEKNFRIYLDSQKTEKSKMPPEQVPINAKEIEIKVLDENKENIENVKAILQVW